MVPKNVDGLLVPVAVSASHVGFSTIRMEPTWAALGQAAGLAGAMAAKNATLVRNIDVSELQRRLHEAGAITVLFGDVDPASSYFKEAQYFGTLGFFHNIEDVRRVKFRWPVGVHEKGIAPYPNHTAELDKPIDKQLAERWIGMLENQEIRRRAVSDPVLRSHKTLTRGDFLQRLFQYVKE